MTKLARFLKPYIWMIVIAVGMLFVQAICDLNLPNYMSDIVNVGLQQGGIETAVPEAISEKTLTGLKMYMSADDAKILDTAYKKVSIGDENYIEKYPLLKTENVYVLNEISPEDSLFLGESFGKIASIAYSVSSGATPEEAVTQAEKSDPATLNQTAVVLVKEFYKELGMDVADIQMHYIFIVGLKMLIITLIGGAAAVIIGFFAARTAAGVAKDLRFSIFSKVEKFSNNEFDKFSTSSLITRTTNDVTQVQMLIIMGIRMIFYAPIIGVGGSIMAVQKGPSISWIIVLAVILMIILIGTIFIIAMPKFKIVQKLIDKLNLVSRENLTGIMAVRAFGNQDFEQERFDAANKDLTKTNLFVNRVMVFMFPAMMLIMNAATLTITWVGANKISESAMQVGDMMAFMQYAMQIIMAFLMISMMFIMVPRASVSATRIAEVLETKPSILDPTSPKKFNPSAKGIVEFKNVSFRYNGAEEDVLRNINFVAKPGETTAIIGSTGSGKSTLINLIPRFYDTTEGEITVNGVNVKDVSQFDLHDSIGFIPQKGVLHSGTITSNLKYGNDNATDEEIQKAAEVAQAMEFISNPDVGFDKQIAQGGSNVSGGQKQRLAIARALVTNAPIYIFDDSFSALDFKTDVALRRALNNYTDNATVIIVAQRVSTIMNAEQILVIDEGEIVGKGTHRELLKSCPTYLEIASSQLSKEELA